MSHPQHPLDAGIRRELRKPRHASGPLTYQAMTERVDGYSAPALSQAACGVRLPSLPVTLAYVAACDGDVDEMIIM